MKKTSLGRCLIVLLSGVAAIIIPYALGTAVEQNLIMRIVVLVGQGLIGAFIIAGSVIALALIYIGVTELINYIKHG